MKLKCAGLVMGLMLAIAGTAYTQVTSGTISGTVKDSSGAVLPGSTVVILNEETGISRTVQTDSGGRYTAPSLNVGMYKITASQTGFGTETRSGIELTVGREAVANFELSVGAVSQTVEVTGEAPLIDTAKSSLGETMGNTSIKELPLNGRDLNQLITLQAGVTDYSNGSHDGGLLITAGGTRTRQASTINYDGVALDSFNGRAPAGQSKVLMGSEGIREFKVETNGFSAEYGRSSGASINFVTKSGTNELHGSAFEFLRNSALDSAKWEDNAFGNGKTPYKRNQFGGSIGGPVKKDRTFFFFTYEGYRDRVNNTITRSGGTLSDSLRAGFVPGLSASQCSSSNGTLQADGTCKVPISPAVQPYLDPNNPALWPEPNGAIHPLDGTADYTYVLNQPTNDNFYQGRVDQRLSDKNSFFGRFTALRSKATLPPKSSPSFPAYQYFRSTVSESMTMEDTYIFSPSILGTFIAGFSRANSPGLYVSPTVDPLLRFVTAFGDQYLGGLSVGTLTAIGTPSQDSSRPITNFQWGGDITITKGRNTYKTGVNWSRIYSNGCNPNLDAGSYSFSTVQSFFQGVPNGFSTATAQSTWCRSLTQNLIGLYFQDEMHITPRFTFFPGLRYEFITVPVEKYARMGNFRGDLAYIQSAGPSGLTLGNPFVSNPSLKNVAPRLGFAWDLFGNGKTAIRGGAGIYYQEFTSPDLVQGIATSMYPFNVSISSSGAGILFPNMFQVCGSETDPAHPQNPICTTRPTIQIVPYKFKNPHVVQYNLNVQHQIGPMVMTVGYAGSHSVHEEAFDNFNTPQGQSINGRIVFDPTLTRPNPNWNDIMAQDQPGWARYNSLVVSVRQRMSHGLQVGGNYSYAKNMDNVSDYKDFLNYLYNPNMYGSVSQLDVRHLFSFFSTYELPVGPGKAFLSGLHGVGEKILAGWELNNIMTARTGFPLMVTTSVPTFLNTIGVKHAVPDLAPGASNNPTSGVSSGSCSALAAGVPLGTPAHYFDPCAFVAAPANTLGNLGRNTLRLPGLFTFDGSLSKTFRITERSKLQFRSEFFNLLNRPNFDAPALNVLNASGSRVATAGAITATVGSARQIQFGLRLEF